MQEGTRILLDGGIANAVLEQVRDRFADQPTHVSDIQVEVTEDGGCYLRYKVDRLDRQPYICGLVHGLQRGLRIK